MNAIRTLLLASLLGLAGCADAARVNNWWAATSTREKACLIGGGLGGAGVAEVTLMTGVLVTACNGTCEEHKIERGETIDQTVHHHVRQGDDILRYVSIAAVPIGAAIGAYIADQFCGESTN